MSHADSFGIFGHFVLSSRVNQGFPEVIRQLQLSVSPHSCPPERPTYLSLIARAQ